MVNVITARGVRWTGLPHSLKTNGDHLIKDNLGRYCPKTFETAKGKKERWHCWDNKDDRISPCTSNEGDSEFESILMHGWHSDHRSKLVVLLAWRKLYCNIHTYNGLIIHAIHTLVANSMAGMWQITVGPSAGRLQKKHTMKETVARMNERPLFSYIALCRMEIYKQHFRDGGLD